MSHILFVNPIWPHQAHTVRSANVVIFELITTLAGMPGQRVSFLRVALPGDDPSPDSHELDGIARMRELGVDVLEPLVLSEPLREDRPSPAQMSAANAVVKSSGADVVLIPWTNWPTILFSEAPAIRFAYYGNPDPKVLRARAAFDLRHGGDRWTHLKSLARAAVLERRHLRDLGRYHLLGDVAANDAAWYSAKGHPNAFYIHNLWIDRFGPGWRERRDTIEQERPVKIIGNIGKMDATGNTHGLELLTREIAPRLDDRLGAGGYEIHLLGANEPHPAVAPMLDRPGIVRRGFVDDVDDELLSAPVFLCMNNASPFKVCHTRYLHAWSLGACVVAHRDAALSIPEMVHGENCLLGSNMDEIADMVQDAAKDVSLRRRLGAAGYETFRETFSAESVAAEIVGRLSTVGNA